VRLALIHRIPGAAPAPADSTAWRTCLREIHFLPGHRVPLETGVLTDADAYALLLEVVCGLRSPLIGETEVQAQFKQFLASTEAGNDPSLKRLGQRVLGDAKRIRHKHLQGFGAHSYGCLTSRYLTGCPVAVVGTGALAAKVIEAAPSEARFDVWGRTPGRPLPTTRTGLSFSLISDASNATGTRTGPASVVIAAPIGAHDLNKVLGCYESIDNVIDLRSSDHQTPVVTDAPVVLLGDILAEAARSEFAGAPIVRAARADIYDLAQAFVGREELRPFGWDDVCA
jgi:glutamyl-tRNA reductase